MEKKELVKCSFCGKNKQDTDVLIAGITAHICDSCIEQAYNILDLENSDQPTLDKSARLIKPQEIKAHLDEYVIGQEQAKKYFLLLFTITINGFYNPTQILKK